MTVGLVTNCGTGFEVTQLKKDIPCPFDTAKSKSKRVINAVIISFNFSTIIN